MLELLGGRCRETTCVVKRSSASRLDSNLGAWRLAEWSIESEGRVRSWIPTVYILYGHIDYF